MRLDRANIVLRSRDSWEAIDLGATMIRAWWRPVYGAWLTVVLPIAVSIHVLLATAPWLALLVLWWLKPLYDRVVLHVLAQAVFGSPPTPRQTLGSLGVLVRSTGLLAALTWRRLAPLRSFHLPVRQLEGQQGGEARQRERLLARRTSGQATGLLYACLLFELTVLLSLNAFIDLLTPGAIQIDYDIQAFLQGAFVSDDTGWNAFIRHVLIFTAISVIEPLYVASGFALYLNRRTKLEAWDIEVAFRRLDRQAAPSSKYPTALLACCMIAGLIGAMPHSAFAAPAQSREAIREVLAAPEFQEHRDQKVWRARNAGETTVPQKPSSSGNLFEAIALTFAQIARIAAYLLIAAVLYVVIRYLLREARNWTPKASPAPSRPLPETVFGLDVRPQALPPNLAELAAQAARHDPRLALSLLYRGALAALIHRDQLPIAVGDTEGDCLQRVRGIGPADRAAFFARLVAAWSETVYAQTPAQTQIIEALCTEWPRHFVNDRSNTA